MANVYYIASHKPTVAKAAETQESARAEFARRESERLTALSMRYSKMNDDELLLRAFDVARQNSIALELAIRLEVALDRICELERKIN